MRVSLILLITFTVVYVGFSQGLERLPVSVNSEYDEISPVLSADGKRLYFTRIAYPVHNSSVIKYGESITYGMSAPELDSLLRKIYSDLADEPIEDVKGSIFNQDIWYAEISETGKIGNVVHPSEPLNNAFPNSVLSVIRETGELIILNDYHVSNMRQGITLYTENPDDGKARFSKLKIANYGSDDGIINLTTSADGGIIIWALHRDDTYGGRDLYVSRRITDKIYSAPRNMGPVLNSPYRESTPFLAADGKTLYFSSNRAGGMGGMDIYYSERLDKSWTRWSKPKALEYPINSGYDDSQPALTEDGKTLYFTSNRNGSSDIFRYNYEKMEEPAPEPELIIMELELAGMVVDAENGLGIPADITWGILKEDENDLENFFGSVTGEFSGMLESGNSYIFFAEARGYYKHSVSLNLEEHYDSTSKIYKVLIPLKKKTQLNEKVDVPVAEVPAKAEEIVTEEPRFEKLVQELVIEDENLYVADPDLPDELKDSFSVLRTYVMKNIYFKRSEAVVLGESRFALNDLYRMMVNNPNEIILISGHTDNVGPEHLLIELSMDRANAIKSYLMRRGIDESRIKTMGYGARKPLNDNSTEDLRQANRRVEISFLSKS